MENNQHKDFDNFFENKLNDRQFEFQDDFWDEMETLLPKNDTDVATAGNSRRRFVWGILWLCLIGFTGWLVYPKEKTDNSITNVHLDFNDNDNFNEEISNCYGCFIRRYSKKIGQGIEKKPRRASKRNCRSYQTCRARCAWK